MFVFVVLDKKERVSLVMMMHDGRSIDTYILLTLGGTCSLSTCLLLKLLLVPLTQSMREMAHIQMRLLLLLIAHTLTLNINTVPVL